MRISNFSVVIPEGIEHETGYVEMIHDTQYKLRLVNHSNKRCNVRLTIDGKKVGTWRISSKSSIDLERPSNDNGKFTFYRCGSIESEDAGIEHDNNAGLIQATFMPEKTDEDALMEADLTKLPMPNYSRMLEHKAGGTGLSGKSEQKFTTAPLIELDEDELLTISLRLITKRVTARPLRPANNEIPPPIY